MSIVKGIRSSGMILASGVRGLEMPHIVRIDESCVTQFSDRAGEFNSRTTHLNVHQRQVFEFGLSKCD